MFSNKTLYIPDYVVYEDIPIIINYFDYYNIAKVKNVEVFKHHEPEYYVEDKYNYGYALITIDYYYNNQGARNFYSAIENKKGLIVYDDPKSWEVMFSPFKENNANVVVNDLQYSSHEDYISDEDYYYSNEDQLQDDFNYANYEKNFASFKKKQNSKKQKLNDQLYEIKAAINNISTKHDKLLKLLLINNELKSKRQKNNQKIKDFKNLWARRLRHQYN